MTDAEAAQDAHEHQGGDEFERRPVPKQALLGFKSFIGMYAGEHCAGTELMIGPLFVAAGVSAFDVVVGLIVGNALIEIVRSSQQRVFILPRALIGKQWLKTRIENSPP